MLEQNYAELNATTQRPPRRFIERGSITQQEGFDHLLQVNRRLLNVLSMMRTCLDHSERFLKQRYGQNSAQVARFKATCSAEYDGHFAYRFFWHLRNYAQHQGRPIQSMRAQSAADRPGPEAKITASVDLLFDRDSLLADSEWKSGLREELKRLPAQFPVLPALQDLMVCMRRVWRAFVEEGLEDVTRSAAHVQGLANEGAEHAGAPFVADAAPPHNVPGGPLRRWNPQTNFLPMNIVRLVDQLNAATK